MFGVNLLGRSNFYNLYSSSCIIFLLTIIYFPLKHWCHLQKVHRRIYLIHLKFIYIYIYGINNKGQII